MDFETDTRHFPNAVSTEDEVFTTMGGSYVSFYPEDIKKMASMTAKEQILYKRELLIKVEYRI